MADLTVELIPNKPLLPVSDDEANDYGELNYIFYPGISACQRIRITNNTAGALTPDIIFSPDPSDPVWWKTLRIYPSCSGVLPSGTFDTGWEGEIPGSGTQDLYVYSKCTKEGFSYKYDGNYWTNAGFNVIDDNYINDEEENGAAVDCDAANAGATLTLDLGEDEAEEFTRIKFSVTPSGVGSVVNASFDIEYSDDGAAWTTVYEDADLRITDHRAQITFWWDEPGAHRYWRITKVDAAEAGGDITEIQWLLFEAHKDAYDFGVYGDHRGLMTDLNGNMDDFQWRSSVMVNVDVFARQNYLKPIGKVAGRTDIMQKKFDKLGQTVQLYYIPTMTFSYNLNGFADFQLEKRIWDVKALLTPQKRELTYTAAADGLQPSLYRYDQRTVYFEPWGPDKVGWYMTNYDFWHGYGHSYYMLYDNHCYKIDDPQPVYIDDELVAFSARIFLQSDMPNLALDPRNYVLSNRDGLFQQFPNGGYSAPVPTDWVDIYSSQQRPVRWTGAFIQYIYSRPLGYSNRPDPYALAGVNSPDDGFPNGEMWITQDWNNPANDNFQTSEVVVFGARVKAGTGNARYFQMPRYYNWLGYVDANGNYDVINWIVQLFYDEDCTMPVKINLEYEQTLSKVEYVFDRAYVTAAGLVTLTALGQYISVDGHTTRTPSKLYVRYIPEDGQTDYFYP